jgi:hypothetical protein
MNDIGFNKLLSVSIFKESDDREVTVARSIYR